MKRSLITIFLLLVMPLVVLPAEAEERADIDVPYLEAEDLAEQLGVEIIDGIPRYTPEEPQSMTAFMVTHPDCEVGIDNNGIFKVSERSLYSISSYLDKWKKEITGVSGRKITFTNDPQKADMIISVKISYQKYGDYYGNGVTSTGYSCIVGFRAEQLTEDNGVAKLQKTNNPGNSVVTKGGEKFWMQPPDLNGSDELKSFVKTILGWYGEAMPELGPQVSLEAVVTGSYVVFGSYPQTKEKTDATPIEWLVLDVNETENSALLISKYALDCQPINKSFENTDWENCTLRTWLNDTFLNRAFTSEEQEKILTTEVDNSIEQGNSNYSKIDGNSTDDRLFLLSVKEAEEFFYTDESRWCYPTEYALAQGAWTNTKYQTKGEKTCAWWLRSPGIDESRMLYVHLNGDYNNYDSVSKDDITVRPALWLSLDP